MNPEPEVRTFSGRRPSQNPEELRSFVRFLLDIKCKSYLEIGARHGDTFHHITQALGKDAVCVALDWPGAAWGQVSSAHALRRAINDLKSRGYRATFIIGDSHDPVVQEKVARGMRYDVVLIDADHRYEAVRADFQDYSTIARYVALHDIVGHGQTTADGSMPVEVPMLWREVKDRYKNQEFIAPGSSMGIGILQMPGSEQSGSEVA